MTDNDRLLQQDILHVQTRFRRELGRELDLANPRTFNEKLQWLKLYRRPPGLNQLVDKWAVRRFVEQKVGSKYLVPVAETPVTRTVPSGLHKKDVSLSLWQYHCAKRQGEQGCVESRKRC